MALVKLFAMMTHPHIISPPPTAPLTPPSPHQVGMALVKLFAEMTLIHGYIHGDPHPGNLMVRPKGGGGHTSVGY